jgi:hypothetical protein
VGFGAACADTEPPSQHAAVMSTGIASRFIKTLFRQFAESRSPPVRNDQTANA